MLSAVESDEQSDNDDVNGYQRVKGTFRPSC